MVRPASFAPSFVLLDRDGVLNFDSPDYVRGVEDWRPIPGALEAVARLTRAGHRVAVVTNQSGIGRGLMTARDVDAIHARLGAAVESLGGRIDGVFLCPHAPDAGCRCRKPRPGLLEAAAAALGGALSQAVLVGDRRTDAEAARAVGAHAVLVESGARLPAADDPVWGFAERAPDLAQWVERRLG